MRLPAQIEDTLAHPMTGTFVGDIDRRVRSIAYDALCRRYGISGWKPDRARFFASAGADRPALSAEAEDKLQRVLRHAYETSPYYRETWKAAGFRPSTACGSADLQRLPFLTKEIVKQHKNHLVSERFRTDELDVSYTGGTTGTQTSFYRDHACTVSRFGRQWAVLEQCGYRPGMRRGLVWGAHQDLPPEGLALTLKQRIRRYASSDETLSCMVISEQMMTDFHRRLLALRPDVLHGYPSAMTELGRFIVDRGLPRIHVGSIISTAERLSESQRTFLHETFGGEVYNLYCTREYGCVGFECARHKGFHIDTGSVFVEIIRNGARVAAGEQGEITITDLLNYGMPVVRNRTGDLGTLSPLPCECGAPWPVLTGLDGRVTDLVYRPDGSVVAGVMLVDLFTDLPSIERAQFVQERADELAVLLVVDGALADDVRTEVVRQVREAMGEQMRIRIEVVPEIARNPRSGKFQEVICRIDRSASPHPAA